MSTSHQHDNPVTIQLPISWMEKAILTYYLKTKSSHVIENERAADLGLIFPGQTQAFILAVTGEQHFLLMIYFLLFSKILKLYSSTIANKLWSFFRFLLISRNYTTPTIMHKNVRAEIQRSELGHLYPEVNHHFL